MYNYWKRVWAEIDLDNLIHNFETVKKQVKCDTKVCCVVKANAYGHNAPKVAKTLESVGADWFAVSNIEEAVELRNYGVRSSILILGYTPPECAELISRNDITQCVFSSDYAKALSACAEKVDCAVSVHIKIDTGMRRIGFVYGTDDSFIEDLEAVFKLPNITVDGIFTHFSNASAGKENRAFTDTQYSRFIDTVNRLEQRGYNCKLKHCSNSAAIFDYPEYQLDMVRAGVALYGLTPFDSYSISAKDLLPVMTLKTVISNIKRISCGDVVGYGCDFCADREMTVATVPLGYADGFWRANSTHGSLIVNGKEAPIIGRVSMDQLMLDITDIDDVHIGNEVTVFGDNECIVTVGKISELCDTINYEIICAVANRVSRVFIKYGKVSDIHFGIVGYDQL